MKPDPTSESVTARMRATRRRDTPAEIGLRRELHSRGFRFRVDAKLTGITHGRPDIAFPTERVAVFVDGCFWHSCPKHKTKPKANSEWWALKLQANEARDRRLDQELRSQGWVVVRIWEHDDSGVAAATVISAVTARRSPG